MTGNITVTGVTGPAKTMTATVFNNADRLDIQFDKAVLFITKEDGKVVPVDLSSIATVTVTIATGVATIAIST